MLYWNKPSDSREVWGAADLETAFLLTRGEFFQFLPASHCSGATTQRTTSLQLQNPSLLISFTLIHTDMALRVKEPEGTTLVILAWRVKKTSSELSLGSRNSVWRSDGRCWGHTHVRMWAQRHTSQIWWSTKVEICYLIYSYIYGVF